MTKKLFHLLKYKELLFAITLREIRVKYKQSVLGVLWAILQPLVLMLIFSIVFSYLTRIPSDGIPYPLFVLTAILPWTFFSSALTSAIPSLISNINILTKIYFPREIFPFAAVLSALVDFSIALIIFAVMMVYYRVPVTPFILFVIPILAVQILLILGLSLFASAVNVYYRDVKHTLPLLLQIWMYISPVIYPLSLVPEKIKWLYVLNPMAPIIDSYRKVTLMGTAPDFMLLFTALITSLIIFVAGYMFFKKLEMTFADVI